MSVLGNKKSPCHAIYNIWLAACGAAVALNSLMLRPLLAVYSKTAAAILAVILGLYAVGGCVLPAFFPVEEKKTLPGFRHASMATALQRGLCCWPPRRRWQAFLHTGPVSAYWRFFPSCAFFWPLFSSLRSSRPISPVSGIRPLRGRGCGSGLPCCVCIFPWRALYLPCCKLREKGRPRHIIAGGRPFAGTSPIFQRHLLFSARSSAAEAGYTPKGSPSRRRTVPRPRGLR